MTGVSGRSGRKPKPTALKVIEGNPGKRELNKYEPRPEIAAPSCPEWLGDEAKAEWFRIVPELIKLNLITKLDRAAIAGYCHAYGRWVDAEIVVKQKGPLYKTSGGNVQTSPMLWVANKAFDQMRQMITEFGLTPSSRARLSVSPPDKEIDPMERLLNGKGNG